MRAGWGGFCNRLGFKSRNLRIGTTVVKGYTRDSFKDAWDRYLPPLSATPLHGP